MTKVRVWLDGDDDTEEAGAAVVDRLRNALDAMVADGLVRRFEVGG